MEKSKIKSYQDLTVWQKSVDFTIKLYGVTESFPKQEMFGLISQLRRAAVSIPSNIAEGFRRKTNKEKLQFLRIAYGSGAEIETQLVIASRLRYLNDADYASLTQDLSEVMKMLNTLINRFEQKSYSKLVLQTVTFLLLTTYYILPTATQAAPVRLFFIPENASVAAGDIIKSDIRIDTRGNIINAVDITVSFGENVEVLSAEKNESILNLWVSEPSFSSAAGRAKFTGGRTGGFEGQGVIGQLYWRSDSAGENAALAFDQSSAVLLNDGLGTKAELETRESAYNILARGKDVLNLSSPSHSNENKWYSQPFVRLSWTVSEGALYSYLIARDPSQLPDDTANEPVGGIKLKDLEDGVYYFKLKEKKPGEEWSPIVSRQIKIDKTSPEFIEVKISRDPTLLQNKFFASFAAVDKTSGIARYEIIEGDSAAEPVLEPPFILKNQNRDKVVVVRAIDAAGNNKDINIPALPWWQRPSAVFYRTMGLIVISIIIVLAAIVFVWRKFRSVQ